MNWHTNPNFDITYLRAWQRRSVNSDLNKIHLKALLEVKKVLDKVIAEAMR